MSEASKIAEWRLRQEHHYQIEQCLKDSGSTIRPSDGLMVGRFNGATFWKLANELGHTSMDFNRCKCKE